jgi:hypothetical protein
MKRPDKLSDEPLPIYESIVDWFEKTQGLRILDGFFPKPLSRYMYLLFADGPDVKCKRVSWTWTPDDEPVTDIVDLDQSDEDTAIWRSSSLPGIELRYRPGTAFHPNPDVDVKGEAPQPESFYCLHHKQHDSGNAPIIW